MRICQLLLLLLAATAGCREQPVETHVTDQMRQFSDLAEVEATHVQALRDEIARIKAEQGTPEQLMSRVKSLPPNQDLNAELAKLFPDQDRLDRILARLDPFVLRDDGRIDDEGLYLLVKLAEQYESDRQQIAVAAGRPNVRMWVDYEMGFAADLNTIEALRVGYRLELIRALHLVDQGRLHEALTGPVTRIFHYAFLLDQVWHLAHRLTAVGFRAQALGVVARIVDHPDCTYQLAELARNQLLYALRRLPVEREAWMGDRAIGLHAFEMVREGYFLSLLSEEESNRLKDAGNRYGTARMAVQNVDYDQLFYLRHMRAIIESSQRPYYQRGDTIQALILDTHEREEGGEYPLVSLEVLLTDVGSVQRRFAKDRARLEIWTIALSHATGQQLPSSDRNPHTGESYEIVDSDGRVVVGGLDLGSGEVNPDVPDYRAR